jgi:hypothetical protein
MAYATVDELAAALRITVTPTNTAALQRCLDAAALEIDTAIDRRPADVVPSATWAFSASTATTNPGTGMLGLNKASLAAVTEIHLNNLDHDGVDRSAGIALVSPVSRLFVQEPTGEWAEMTVTGPPVNNTGWFTIPATTTETSTTVPSFTGGELLIVRAVSPSPLLAKEMALAKSANIRRGVEWWKANDAARDLIVTPGSPPPGAGKRTVVGHAAADLLPLKQQWGIG